MPRNIKYRHTGTVTERGRTGGGGGGGGGGGLGSPKWAAHVPGRALMGFIATDKAGSNLNFPDQLNILAAHVPRGDQHVAFRRSYIGTSSAGGGKWFCTGSNNGVFETAEFNAHLNYADGLGIVPYVSVKVPGDDWAGVVAGSYDNDLNAFVTYATARQAAGGKPFLVTIHHEPEGNGDLSIWSQMQIYASNFFSSINNYVTYAPCGNAFWLGKFASSHVASMNAVFGTDWTNSPLINTLTANRGVLTMDAYDVTNIDDTPTTGDHTVLKVGNWIQFCRDNNVQSFGFGEWGCHGGSEIDAVWALIKANTDVVHVAAYFTSAQNARADWRCIPNGYPPDPVVSGDTGGTSTPIGGSQGRLDSMVTLLNQAQYAYLNGVQQ